MAVKKLKILTNVKIPNSMKLPYGHFAEQSKGMKRGSAAIVDTFEEASCLVRAGYRQGWMFRKMFQKEGAHKGKYLVYKVEQREEKKSRIVARKHAKVAKTKRAPVTARKVVAKKRPLKPSTKKESAEQKSAA